MTHSPPAAVGQMAESGKQTAKLDRDSHSSASTLQHPNATVDAEKASSPKANQFDNEPPDGGLAAWLVVLGVWCTSFCSFGWLNSIGVFQEYYQNVLLSNYSPSSVSWIPSLQIFFMMGMGPFVGAIYDSYGPRSLLLVGSFLHVFGVIMTSLGTKYYQIILAQGFCSGIGMSMIFQPAFSCIRGWFSRKQGAAFGILFTGSSLGGVIFPIMVSRLIREVGFGWAMRTSGFLMLFLLITANLTVRPRVPPRPQTVTLAQLRKPFTELDFLLVTAGIFLFSYGFFVPINYLPVEALATGVDANLVQCLIPILNAASLFGRMAAGFLGDKIGRFNIFVVVCYMSGVWVLALWLPDSSIAAIIAFAALFGFFSGAYVSLIALLVMKISPMKEIGFRTGIVLFVTAIGGLTTNPINGAILENAGGWASLKIFSGVFCLAGTTFVLVVRIRRTGWKVLSNF